MEQPRLLTIKQVAHLLAVSPRTVRRLVEEGKLAPGERLTANTVRWFPADVRDYLHRLRRGDFRGSEKGVPGGDSE